MVLCETVLPRAFAALRKWWREQAKARESGAIPPNRTVAASATGVATVVPLASASRRDADGTDLPAPGLRDADGTVAQRLWKVARSMPHGFIPNPETDGDYLAKVYGAAKLGHLEAMAKLGEYAGRRGAVVEAFYWTILAELKGATGLGIALREMRSRWLSEGCPEEYENAYTDFTEEQGVFARAVLRLQCGVDPQYACARLKELADRGVEESRLFLGI